MVVTETRINVAALVALSILSIYQLRLPAMTAPAQPAVEAVVVRHGADGANHRARVVALDSGMLTLSLPHRARLWVGSHAPDQLVVAMGTPSMVGNRP